MLDVVQISYYEPYADDNFELLQLFAPHAKRVEGVKGIFEAHKAAAEIAETSHFYVIDADAVMDEEFSFRFKPDKNKDAYPNIPETDCVYVWRSRNPVNDLLYGYGGAKLFKRQAMLDAEYWNIDMTTTLGCPFVPKFQVSNITQFNTDPYSTWRSAFRETVKLTLSKDTDADRRLNKWLNPLADCDYCDDAMLGAKMGKEFALENKHKPEVLNNINDYEWLENTWKQLSQTIGKQ